MTADDTTTVATRLCEGLVEERGIYETLVDLTRRQDEILRRGETEEILRLARAKEAEVDRIERIESVLSPLKRRWTEIRDQVAEAHRDRIEEELGKIEGVLRTLIDLENQGQAGVEAIRRETADSLRKVDGGRRVQKAYHSPRAQAPPRYLDRTE